MAVGLSTNSFRASYAHLALKMLDHQGNDATTRVASAVLNYLGFSRKDESLSAFSSAVYCSSAITTQSQFLASLLKNAPDPDLLSETQLHFFNQILTFNGTPNDYMQLLNLQINGQSPLAFLDSIHPIPDEFEVKRLTASKVDALAYKMFEQVLIKKVAEYQVKQIPSELKAKALELLVDSDCKCDFLAQFEDFEIKDERERFNIACKAIEAIGYAAEEHINRFDLSLEHRHELYNVYAQHNKQAWLDLNAFKLRDDMVASALDNATDPHRIVQHYAKMEDDASKGLCLTYLDELLGSLPTDLTPEGLRAHIVLQNPLRHFRTVINYESDYPPGFFTHYCHQAALQLTSKPPQEWEYQVRLIPQTATPHHTCFWEILYKHILEKAFEFNQEEQLLAYFIAAPLALSYPTLPINAFPKTPYQTLILEMRAQALDPKTASTFRRSFDLSLLAIEMNFPLNTKIKKLIYTISTHRNFEISATLSYSFSRLKATPRALFNFKQLIKEGMPIHMHAPILVLCAKETPIEILREINRWGSEKAIRHRLRENLSGFMQVLLKTFSALEPGQAHLLLPFLELDPIKAKANFHLLYFAFVNHTPPHSIDELHPSLLKSFETGYGIPLNDIPNLANRYQETFGSLRHQGAFETYLAGLKPLLADDKGLSMDLARFARSVLLGTFKQERYRTDNSPHFGHLSKHYKSVFDLWRKGIFTHEGTEISDRMADLFLMGDIPNSCMRVDKDADNNKALLGTVLDGAKKLITIRDERGNMLVRAIVYLLVDERKSPVLYLEKPYGALTGLSEMHLNKMYQTALAYAKALQVPLATGHGQTTEGAIIRYTPPKAEQKYMALSHLGSPVKYHYVDSGEARINLGGFKIPHAEVAHRPRSKWPILALGAATTLLSAALYLYTRTKSEEEL